MSEKMRFEKFLWHVSNCRVRLLVTQGNQELPATLKANSHGTGKSISHGFLLPSQAFDIIAQGDFYSSMAGVDRVGQRPAWLIL
jgi:hypothetical protein